MTQTQPGPNVAVLLAGGVGTRVGLDIPKQLIKIAGKTILEHTLAAFQAHPMVDEIMVMMAPGHLDAVRAMVRTGGYDKVTQVLEGADTRNGTTLRALDARSATRTARCSSTTPCARWSAPRIITECFERLETYDAVDVAIPSADTIIEVDRRQHDPGDPAAGRPAPRPDPAGASGPRCIRAAYDARRRRTPTSPPPTTAASC